MTASEAVDRAIAVWAQRSWMKTWNQVVLNLTEGYPMLRTRTGTLRKHVESASRFTSTGFAFAVGLVYGVAWHGRVSGTYPNWSIAPTPRKEYFVRPVTKKALSWVDGVSGARRFSRGHKIRAWEFKPPRPFLAKPMIDLYVEYRRILEQTLTEETNRAFPDKVVQVRLVI